MQLVNGEQFLFIMYFLLFAAGLAATLFGTIAVALTSIYASLKSDKVDLNIDVLNLIWLLTL